MKLATFDLEIAKAIPDDVNDWQAMAPLGITCAAVALSDQSDVIFWKGVPKLSRSECRRLVADLQDLVKKGYTLVTWNGCAFDFCVLAQESGLQEECATLALSHVDLMLIVTFQKGHYLALQKALEGANIEGKRKKVVLSTGEVIHDMEGKKAPLLWAAKEYDAVLYYLRGDVTQLMELTQDVYNRRRIKWTSNRGRPQEVAISKLYTVKECFSIPEPDTSWMTDPPDRQSFLRWTYEPMDIGITHKEQKTEVFDYEQENSIPSISCSAESLRHIREIISHAIRDKHILNIDYITSNQQRTNRDIAPLKITDESVYAYCKYSSKYRHFRINRITTANITSTHFMMGDETSQHDSQDVRRGSMSPPKKKREYFMLMPWWAWAFIAFAFYYNCAYRGQH
jgi:hypothetical protein